MQNGNQHYQANSNHWNHEQEERKQRQRAHRMPFSSWGSGSDMSIGRAITVAQIRGPGSIGAARFAAAWVARHCRLQEQEAHAREPADARTARRLQNIKPMLPFSLAPAQILRAPSSRRSTHVAPNLRRRSVL
jgi:hypothetical protein